MLATASKRTPHPIPPPSGLCLVCGATNAHPICEQHTSASVVFVAQTASLSVSPEIVAAREDFFNHGWTRINTDEDGFSLIRVHPCSSVVGSYWLRLRRAALYRRMPSCRTAPWPGRRNTAKALPICNRRYGRLAICATLNRDGALRCDGRRTGVHARWRWNAKHIRKPPEPARWKAT